jgi:hypothetical protein
MGSTMGGISFREVMSGPATLGATDPATGASASSARPLVMRGTITIGDIAAFIADVNHQGSLDVTMSWPQFGADVRSDAGVFKLFSPSGDPKLKLMVYEWRVEFAGRSYYFAGEKLVPVHPIYKLWHDTTTLYTRIHDGRDATGPVVGAGILSLGPLQLAQLLISLQVPNANSLGARFRTVAAFLRFFLAQLWVLYVRKGA